MIWVWLACLFVLAWAGMTMLILIGFHRTLTLRDQYARPVDARHRLDTGMVEVVRD